MPEKEKLLSELSKDRLFQLAEDAGIEDVSKEMSKQKLIGLISQYYSVKELRKFIPAREKKFLLIGLMILVAGIVVYGSSLYIAYTMGIRWMKGRFPQFETVYWQTLAVSLMTLATSLRAVGGAMMAYSLFSIGLNPRYEFSTTHRIALIACAVACVFVVAVPMFHYPFYIPIYM